MMRAPFLFGLRLSSASGEIFLVCAVPPHRDDFAFKLIFDLYDCTAPQSP